MSYIIILIVCALVIYVVVRVLIKHKIREEAEELAGRIAEMSSYANSHHIEVNPILDKLYGNDISSDLEKVYNGMFITFTLKKNFSEHYQDIYNECCEINRKLEKFGQSVPDAISNLILEFETLDNRIFIHNEKYLKAQLDTHNEFFEHCLDYPLDKQQRRSIVSEEDNCLVVSSAGSGKTSSIVGKVKYLLEKKNIDPKRILLISYTNKAALELTERMATPGLRGYTFHKLAIDLIGKETGVKPTICENTDALFVKIYHELLKCSAFKKNVVEYFLDYQIQESEEEKLQQEKRQQLSDLKTKTIKALFPDMDGRNVYVRSEQEKKICFVLSSLGVDFRYEEQYEHQLADETHCQYRPDFSIYFKKGGETKRIYLEHYGIDEHGLVPVWFAEDKNISYEEANQQYNDGITWKKAAHEKFGTTLLTTSSADFKYLDIKNKLKDLLSKEGVPVHEKTDEELYDMLAAQGSKEEKAFIRLVVTFITLVKTSCKSINSILQQTRNVNDERSTFIIEKIFKPVYDLYLEELKNRGEIDFTDAILQATQICRKSHPLEYDYIIVDEFQDISQDRYNFLKELRYGNPPAKLYCVGDDWQSIYRFSGSDMALFNQFSEYFGYTDINKIETTYRFGEPLVSQSAHFIQCNEAQIKKNIHPFKMDARTDMQFYSYSKVNYCAVIENLIASIPTDKSIFLLGRYSFDDYYLSFKYQSHKEGNKFYYNIAGRKIEFLTAHKSKGLEADYVIILQCNRDTYGFPSMVSDDTVLNYVLTKSDKFPYGEERRLFYVAITRAKIKTMILYDEQRPSVFVDEFLHPEKITQYSYHLHRNANKRWTPGEDKYLLMLQESGKSTKYIAEKMGRSQTSIIMRLGKLKTKN